MRGFFIQKLNRSLLGVFVWVAFSSPILAKDQGIMPLTYGVEENYLLLQSIDATVSHYGDEDDRVLYKRCVQHYLEFQNMFYKRRYKRADQSVLRMQKLLIPLYQKLIVGRHKYLQTELQRIALLARAKDKVQTKTFIRLSYRNLHESEQKLKVAMNTRPYLYLLKLRDLLFSLKIQKQASKYLVLLGLLHLTDQMDSIQDTEFFELEANIKNTLPKEDKEIYRMAHYDNSFQTMEKESYLSMFMKNPDMEELEKPLGDLDPAYFSADVPVPPQKGENP